MGLTFAERVLARKAGLASVVPGQIVTVSPDRLLTHDNTAAISKLFRQIGVERMADPAMSVIVLDHVTPPANEAYATNHQIIRRFVAEQGITAFHDVGEGICHQVLPEQGHVWPGSLIVGSDSHTPTHGAFGAFATGIGRTEAAAVMATGRIWLRVPASLRVEVDGRLPDLVTAKDVILYIIGQIGSGGANYCSIEFCGGTVREMSIPSRMVLTNMAAEMGAKNAVVEADATTRDWLEGRVGDVYPTAAADPDASYAAVHRFDVSDLSPQVARPHAVDNVVPVADTEGIRIDQGVIGTCTNGRLEDLAAAAKILRGRRISEGVRLLVLPASREVLLAAMREGITHDLVAAGATLLNPGCGPCLGAHQGCMAPGEVTLSTANRNFRGRMGSKEAQIYLASPATVAASALAGAIVDPRTVGPAS
jgi:3-isopropylmalate/(R)-2-methylmalate dehydratase large subunit